jgi:hypothetical protein
MSAHEWAQLLLMSSFKGNRICLLETKDAPHDIILAGHLSGFVKEAENAVKHAGDYFGL